MGTLTLQSHRSPPEPQQSPARFPGRGQPCTAQAPPRQEKGRFWPLLCCPSASPAWLQLCRGAGTGLLMVIQGDGGGRAHPGEPTPRVFPLQGRQAASPSPRKGCLPSLWSHLQQPQPCPSHVLLHKIQRAKQPGGCRLQPALHLLLPRTFPPCRNTPDQHLNAQVWYPNAPDTALSCTGTSRNTSRDGAVTQGRISPQYSI